MESRSSGSHLISIFSSFSALLGLKEEEKATNKYADSGEIFSGTWRMRRLIVHESDVVGTRSRIQILERVDGSVHDLSCSQCLFASSFVLVKAGTGGLLKGMSKLLVTRTVR